MNLAAFLGAFAAGLFAGAAIVTGLDREERMLAYVFAGFAIAALVPSIALAVIG